MSWSKLPEIIECQIILHLDLSDIVRMRLICSSLKALVDTLPRIQYRIFVGKQGFLVRDPLGDKLDVAGATARHAVWLTNWRNFNPNKPSRTVPLCNSMDDIHIHAEPFVQIHLAGLFVHMTGPQPDRYSCFTIQDGSIKQSVGFTFPFDRVKYIAGDARHDLRVLDMIADGGRRISCMFTAQALEPVPSPNSKLLSFRHDYHPIYQAHICEGLFLYQCQEFPTTTTVVIDLQTAHEIWRRDQDLGEKMSSILLSSQLVAVCTSKSRINSIELHRLTSSNVVARLALPAMTAPWSIQCANWRLTTSSSNPRYNVFDDPNEEIICLFIDISRGRSAHPDIHQFVIAIKKTALIQIAEASPDSDRTISWEVWGVDARVIPVGDPALGADFAASRSRILLQGSAVQMSRIVGYSVSSDLEINYYALVDFSNRGHQSSSKKRKPRTLYTLPSTTFTEFFEDDVTNGLPFSFRLAPVKKDCCTGRIKGMNDQLVIVLKHDELLIWEMGEP